MNVAHPENGSENPMLSILHCIGWCLYIIIFCSLFFCIFKVEHNTCVTPDTEQPGCGKHFPLKFFLAKRYVQDTLLLSLYSFLYFALSFCILSSSVLLSLLLPSLLCDIYQIFVIFNVAFFHCAIFWTWTFSSTQFHENRNVSSRISSWYIMKSLPYGI